MRSLPPFGLDALGLRRAVSDRMLPLLVAAMAFLAALALAGWFGSAALSRHWQRGAGAELTVQVPQPSEPASDGEKTRLTAVLGLLADTRGVAATNLLSDRELEELLKPWLGQETEPLAIPVPAVIAVWLSDTEAALEPLSQHLAEVAPGSVVEDHGIWIGRLTVLVRSLQACSGLALLLVAGVAAAVISVATRAGLSTRRDAIEIVHGLGATDAYIAARLAARATILAAAGAACGVLVALPILLTLAGMALPFVGGALSGDPDATLRHALAALPAALWLAVACLPLGAAAIGFVTAQSTVRQWLLRLP